MIQEYINKIVHGDCLDVLARLPPDSVDMIFTDPPYGHKNNDGDLNSRLNHCRKVDNRPIVNDDQETMRQVVSSALDQAARILKRSSSCCCCCCSGGGPSPTFAWLAQRMDEGGLDFFHSVIWDKRNPGLGWRYRRQHEMIMIAHRSGGHLRWADDSVTQCNIIAMLPPRKRIHPNEKPLNLVRRFIALHTLPGDLVVDPFAGSGTTAVACHELGRRFICIECDLDFVNKANERIMEAQLRTSLFNRNENYKTAASRMSQEVLAL